MFDSFFDALGHSWWAYPLIFVFCLFDVILPSETMLLTGGILAADGSMALGGVIGLLLASVSKLITFGGEVLIYFPVASILDAVVWTVVIGIGLTVAGAVYPARVAAKMKPVDAMRVEQ